MPGPSTDILLRHARREALFAFGAWLAAMTYTVGYCYLFGYGRDPHDVRLTYGVPDWVLYGVVAPWTACTAFAWWYTFGLVSDDDLGPDLESAGDALPDAAMPDAVPTGPNRDGGEGVTHA